MLKIRKGLFETNSSSTHSLTMCSEEDYDKWENGEVYLCEDGKFYTKEEVINELYNDKYYKVDKDLNSLSKEDFDDYVEEFEFYTHDKYWDDEYLEGFSDTYTTKSGETIVAFGKYGYDG